jgi:hypothetical protein
MTTQYVTQAVSDVIDATGCNGARRNYSRERLDDILLPVLACGVDAIVAIGYQHYSIWASLFSGALRAIRALRAGTGGCAVDK